MRCEGRKTLERKVERRVSSSGEGVGWNVGRAPIEVLDIARGLLVMVVSAVPTMLSPRWTACEGT